MKRPRIRRLFRFTLGTLLVVVTVLCVLLGLGTAPATRQKEAVAWVEEMGGKSEYGYESVGISQMGFMGGRRNMSPPGPKWLRELIGVDYFATVESVNLLYCDEATDLSPLAKLTDLRTLRVYGIPVSDLSPLAKLTSLECLILCEIPVSDVSPLAKLTNLEILSLDEIPVSDLSPLAKLTSLGYLSLNDTKVTDLSPLAKLTTLKQLDLQDTPVTDEEVAKLQKALPKCKILGRQ